MTRKLLGVWFHLEKNVQGGPATIGGVQDNEVYGITGSFLDENVTSSRHRISGTGSDFRDEVSGSLSKKVYN